MNRNRNRFAAVLTTISAGFAIATIAIAGQIESVNQPEGERLTLSVDDFPLVELLASVSRQTGIVFTLQGDASRVRVSDSFQNLELGRALQRVLSAHSYMLIDHGAFLSPRHIGLILLASTSSRAKNTVLEIGPNVADATLSDETAELLLNRAVSSASAAERAAATEALAYHRASDASDIGYVDQVLEQMLSDPDENVRGQALESLKDTADQLPFATLAQMVREDRSTKRRIQALELLVERAENGEAGDPLRSALNDPEPAVSNRARELVEDLHIPL